MMPLPPCTSIASDATCLPSSVLWYFKIAEGTAGFSPFVIAVHVTRDAAIIVYTLPAMRAIASPTP